MSFGGDMCILKGDAILFKKDRGSRQNLTKKGVSAEMDFPDKKIDDFA